MSVSSLSKLAISIPREAVYAPAAREFLASGVVPLDRLLGGGLPRGKISEITGPSSCGKTSLLMRILAEATRRGEFVAYVDAFDCLDPASACRAGVDPGRMFWLRHRQPEASRRIRSALEAADIVVRCDGFGVVVLDLQPASPTVSSGALGRTSFSVWHRLKRLLRGKSTLLLLLAEAACSGKCRQDTNSSVKRPRLSTAALAWAITYSPSSIADKNSISSVTLPPFTLR